MKWYTISKNGLDGDYFPLWLKWPDGDEKFFRQKTDLELWPDWRTAVEFAYAVGEQYRVMQIVDHFFPQHLIMGQWELLSRWDKGHETLADAKRAIAYAIDNNNPDARVIHPYP